MKFFSIDDCGMVVEGQLNKHVKDSHGLAMGLLCSCGFVFFDKQEHHDHVEKFSTQWNDIETAAKEVGDRFENYSARHRFEGSNFVPIAIKNTNDMILPVLKDWDLKSTIEDIKKNIEILLKVNLNFPRLQASTNAWHREWNVSRSA